MRTEHYVTLFDSKFLPQGLALHESLERHGGEFVLWVLCLDDKTQRFLDGLRRPTLRTIALRDVETPELTVVKDSRTRAEYCWTLTPHTPKLVFERDATVLRVTYVDADMFLLRSPAPIFAEFDASGKAVQITDHAYDPMYDRSALFGQYCVQFMTFVRDRSEPVRSWWEAQCHDWCYARPEDGKFGDQKYLDDWPERFPNEVHVLSQLDVLLAPWNARRFPYSRAIAWHFHALRLLPNREVLPYGPYTVPEVVDRYIYRPYLESLARQLALIGESVVQADVGGRRARLTGKLRYLLVRLRKALGFPPAYGKVMKL